MTKNLQDLHLKNVGGDSKTVIVTGACRGIGFAVSKVLLRYGCTVILTGRDKQPPSQVAELLEKTQAHYYQCDVSSLASVTALAQTLKGEAVSIDAVINNAGVIDPISHLHTSEMDLWTRAIDVNVKGPYLMMRTFLPGMIEQKHGTIVNLSSGAANSALEGWSHYCASKAAVKKLTEVSQKELDTLHPDIDVQVIGLSPGTVATDMMRSIKQSGINPVSAIDWGQHIPPEWVGEAVAFLLSPAGKEFSGTDFSIKTPEGRRRVGLPCKDAPDKR